MKLNDEIESEVNGRVTKILAESTSGGYGQGSSLLIQKSTL